MRYFPSLQCSLAHMRCTWFLWWSNLSKSVWCKNHDYLKKTVARGGHEWHKGIPRRLSNWNVCLVIELWQTSCSTWRIWTFLGMPFIRWAARCRRNVVFQFHSCLQGRISGQMPMSLMRPVQTHVATLGCMNRSFADWCNELRFWILCDRILWKALL